MTQPLVSFILPNYNNEYILDLMFQRFLENNTYPNYEFIVVDDGSEDNGVALLRKWQASGRIKNMTVIAKKHEGIIPALNCALDHVRGEFIIRLDGDATVETKGFVEKLLQIYAFNPDKIGVITGLTMTDTGSVFTVGRNVIWPQGITSEHREPTEPIGHRTWDTNLQDRPDADQIVANPAEVDTVLGCFAFCDTATARKIKGFDPGYPLWIEDDDFYLSFRLFGKKCFYVPDILICHRLSLRGNRNPAAWHKSACPRWFFHKVIKENKTKYKLFYLTIFEIYQKKNKRIYSLFGRLLPVFYRTVSDLSWRQKILLQDYAHWQDKWGFSILNPDMDYILKRYQGTELVWRYTPHLKKIGEEIVSQIKQLEQEWKKS